MSTIEGETIKKEKKERKDFDRNELLTFKFLSLLERKGFLIKSKKKERPLNELP